jgi:hypothetical protein
MNAAHGSLEIWAVARSNHTSNLPLPGLVDGSSDLETSKPKIDHLLRG